MDHVLVGLSAPTLRFRPIGGAPCGLLSFAVAQVPITPVWLWLVLIIGINLVPWALGAVWRTGPKDTWRLSQDGLECLRPDGSVRVAYARRRIEEFVLTTEDDVLFVLHKFGGTTVGRLDEMGFERLTFFVAARRIGIPMHVLDTDQSVFEADDDTPPPGRSEHRRLLAQEAQLLKAVHEPAQPTASAPVTELFGLERRDMRLVLLGAVVGLLGVNMTLRLGVESMPGDDAPEAATRFVAGLWLVIAAAGAVMTRRYWLRRAPLHWTVASDVIQVRHQGLGDWRISGEKVAALSVGRGPAIDPGEREIAQGLTVLVFGHRLELLARLPARGLDTFELAHVISEHGYQVISKDAGRPRPTDPGYGLEGLPEIFKKVPGGRLVVDDGIGWADATGETVLRLPRDRLGRLELLTVNGQAWLRLYDADGDEFFTAPLSVLRTSRTELRDSARRAGLPVTDAEYDAYESAVLHRAFTAGGVAGTGGDQTGTDAEPPTADGAEYLLDSSRLMRRLSYLLAFTVGQVGAIVSAVLLRGELGGFWVAWAWSAGGGLLLGAVLAWRYDRNRPQLRVSTAGLAAVRRGGRVQWRIGRAVIGGIGFDRSEDDRRPRLVVWNPAGRLVRLLPVGPDLSELRRACEKCGLPWGPPGTGAAAPPPEL